MLRTISANESTGNSLKGVEGDGKEWVRETPPPCGEGNSLKGVEGNQCLHGVRQ